jgi:hypothetical protein
MKGQVVLSIIKALSRKDSGGNKGYTALSKRGRAVAISGA